jgi:hypothetical protein
MLATGAKSGDSAREPSGEPSGAMGGGVVVKQEDSATGEGTTSATVHKQGTLSPMLCKEYFVSVHNLCSAVN